LTRPSEIEFHGCAETFGVVVVVEVSVESVVMLARGCPELQHEATTNKKVTVHTYCVFAKASSTIQP
jgi:hypothetical protein